MEEKTGLIVESQKLGVEISEIETRIGKLRTAIQDYPTLCRREIAAAVDKSQKAFYEGIENKKKAVYAAVSSKKSTISAKIDAIPEQESGRKIKSQDIEEVESHLMKVYPSEMITDYLCLNPKQFEDEEEAYEHLQSAKDAVLNLQRDGIAATVFNGLSALLDQAADYPQLGVKVAAASFIFTVAGLIVSPFLFLTVYTALGAVCGIQGWRVQHLLRKIYSVKLYMENAYDEEQFAADKEDIMNSVCDYLDEAQTAALNTLDGSQYESNPDTVVAIQTKFDNQTLNAQNEIGNLEKEHAMKSQRLEEILRKIAELEEKEKLSAANARKTFLQTITWNMKWLDKLFIDLTENGYLQMVNYSQGNSLYYSEDESMIKRFSKLVMLESLLYMHPDFASNVVLDYKYNGGDLTQFFGLSDRCCKICYTEDDIQAQSESISNKIRSRTNKILSSSSSIEEYNKLMATFNSSGEYYVVVHVFGINALSSQLLSNIKNGPRVGYFYKFYLTTKDLIAIKDAIPLEEIKDFLEIGEVPMPRSSSAVRRVLAK